MSIVQRVLGPLRANPPGEWESNLCRSRMRGTPRARRLEVGEKLRRHTGRAGVRIPNFAFQFLPMYGRMSRRVCPVTHRERAGCVVGDSV